MHLLPTTNHGYQASGFIDSRLEDINVGGISISAEEFHYFLLDVAFSDANRLTRTSNCGMVRMETAEDHVRIGHYDINPQDFGNFSGYILQSGINNEEVHPRWKGQFEQIYINILALSEIRSGRKRNILLL